MLPLLSALTLWFDGRRREPAPRRKVWVEIAPQVLLLGAVLVVRRAVLHGWGGSGDARAGLVGTLVQVYGAVGDLHRQRRASGAAGLRRRDDNPGPGCLWRSRGGGGG